MGRMIVIRIMVNVRTQKGPTCVPAETALAETELLAMVTAYTLDRKTLVSCYLSVLRDLIRVQCIFHLKVTD